MRRLRTARVVVSRWSNVAMSVGHDYHPTLMTSNEADGGDGCCTRRPSITCSGRVHYFKDREAVRQNRVVLTAPEASVRPAPKCLIYRA